MAKTATVTQLRPLAAGKGERLPETPEEALAFERLLEINEAIKSFEEEAAELKTWALARFGLDNPETLASILKGEEGKPLSVRFDRGKAMPIVCNGKKTVKVEALLIAFPELASIIEKYTEVGEPYAYVRFGR